MLRFKILAIVAVCAQAVCFEIDDWNTLLGADDLFPAAINSVRIRGRYAAKPETILRKLKTVLQEPNVLPIVYNRFLFTIISNLYAAHEKQADNITHRMLVFQDDLMEIASHNVQAKEGLHSWFMGITQLTDLTSSGFMEQMTSKNFNLKLMEDPKLVLKIAEFLIAQGESLDWSKMGSVTPVKNQKRCGSCTAFAVSATMESAIAIKRKTPPQDLSAQEILGCADPNENICQVGMSFSAAFDYIQKNGLTNWATYPYEATQGKCRRNAKIPTAQLVEWRSVKKSETALMNAVMQRPVTVAIFAGNSFQNYKSGVFEGICRGPANHAVTVVGYTTLNNYKSWVVKNSWGTRWGMKGYIQIKREAGNLCGIADEAVIPFVE